MCMKKKERDAASTISSPAAPPSLAAPPHPKAPRVRPPPTVRYPDATPIVQPAVQPVVQPASKPLQSSLAPSPPVQWPTTLKSAYGTALDDEELCAISLRTRSKSKLATPKPGVGNVGNIFEVRAEAALSQSQRERPASTGRDDPVARSLLTTLDAEED